MNKETFDKWMDVISRKNKEILIGLKKGELTKSDVGLLKEINLDKYLWAIGEYHKTGMIGKA